MHKGQLFFLLGAIGLIVGALLPWLSITSFLGTMSKAGYEGDGLVTGGIGILLLLIAIFHKGKPGQSYSPFSSFFALVAGSIVVFDLINGLSLLANLDTELILASVGSGMYITILGAALALIGGLMRLPMTT